MSHLQLQACRLRLHGAQLARRLGQRGGGPLQVGGHPPHLGLRGLKLRQPRGGSTHVS